MMQNKGLKREDTLIFFYFTISSFRGKGGVDALIRMCDILNRQNLEHDFSKI